MPKRKRAKNKGNGGNSTEEKSTWSKSKKRHMRKMQKAVVKDEHENPKKAENESENIAKSAQNEDTVKEKLVDNKNEQLPPSGNDALSLGKSSIRPKSALQQAFLSRLAGSRFRELNEDLYTTNSTSAFERFQNNPELFDQYHEGFREQVKSWSLNPVDAVYRWILSVNRNREAEDKAKPLTIADFGCGDAKLAEKLLKIKNDATLKKKRAKSKKKQNSSSQSDCQFIVHSFDLVANGNPHITPCDMANVPIKNGTADIAVFVLALMGTNIADFIREAHRVLTPDGILKIAEVRSRFEQSTTKSEDDGDESLSKLGRKGGRGSNGKINFKYSKKKSDDSLLNDFVDVMKQLGFRLKDQDKKNKMFILLEFEKTGKKPSKDATFTAKPCIYKRR